MRRGGGGGGGRSHGNYTNPCLTMHQPWASLLVCGIKRIEGRSWPAPIRGRLWIHAAGKIPEEGTIKAMEDFYREIYAVDGISDVAFPEHYPVSRLLGCVEVVGCVKCEELASWEAVSEGVRLEGQTDYCWLCEQPQKLLIPFEMRGYQGVYNLEKKIYEAAFRGLVPVQGPMPTTFPLPNPQDPFSLKPGSLLTHSPEIKGMNLEKSSSLTVAIAGARAAATQFNKKEKNYIPDKQSGYSTLKSGNQRTTSLGDDQISPSISCEGAIQEPSVSNDPEQQIKKGSDVSTASGHRRTREDLKQLPASNAKIFAAAVRGLKPS
ncbi:hypothetical protein K2173_015196 [Erythroxylum novogranatense]|uniref:ASCH domain-containing protein n=1 Tax=Erythroxylum novogranatense TaxID=1862640 RepID=A0AAV8T329_9ROSI|nr:hypothetical protein K2173_015196 [Erythroxylum novogranatense]